MTILIPRFWDQVPRKGEPAKYSRVAVSQSTDGQKRIALFRGNIRSGVMNGHLNGIGFSSPERRHLFLRVAGSPIDVYARWRTQVSVSKIILAWIRSRAPHRAQRLSAVYGRRGDAASAENWKGWRVGNLRPIYEPVLWFVKPYRIGTTIADNVLKHGVGAYDEESFLRYVDEPANVLRCGLDQKERGLHSAQKPVRLMQALIELTTWGDQLILDPFAGSGSTLVAAMRLGRRYLGFELVPEYVETCKKRLNSDLFRPN